MDLTQQPVYKTEPETHVVIKEAKRCLQCAKPLCVQGCPIGNNIPGFVGALAKGNIGHGLFLISEKSNLPAVCGRVCPHELQCEGHCVLNKKGTPVAIGRIERYLADFGFEMDLAPDNIPAKTRGNVAVIGSGPAGLTIAGDLAKQGFLVTVYESESEPGGVLLYGIPTFRLPKDIVRREIKRIESLGVNFLTNQMIGPDLTIDDLFARGHEAIFIGTGTALSRDLDLPGRHLNGIIQASYLLHSQALYDTGQIPKEDVPLQEGDKVIVIGGGNVAMDAARTAIRLGAKTVTVVYHREEENLTALRAEYEDALGDGVQFQFESNSTEYLPHRDNHTVAGLIVETLEGQKILGADKIFLAVGSRPANRIVSSTQGINVNERGYVVTRERPYGMTSRKAVFAGGDVVHQPATVVLAMKEAKKVADGIATYLDAVHLLDL